MTARINQAPVLVLAEEVAEAVVNQAAVLVLWGTGSTATVDQASVLVLSSFPRRRIVTITD